MKIFESFVDLINDKSFIKNNIAFIPTMGHLHAGHMSLIKNAENFSKNILVSIYVNEAQFNDPRDFENYPRTLEEDIQKLRDTKCKFLITPKEYEIKNISKAFDPSLEPKKITEILCGKYRPGHFLNVMDIVHRFFQILNPKYAFFGKKDMQQLMVIKELVKLKNYPIEIIPCETIRDANGLAMSSRNTLLSPDERMESSILFESLSKSKQLFGLKKNENEIIDIIKNDFESSRLDLEYFEILNLPSITSPKGAELYAFISAHCGKIRLIDNMLIGR